MVTAAQLKKPILIATAANNRTSLPSVPTMPQRKLWCGLGTRTAKQANRVGSATCSYSQELPSRYYVGLNLQGYVDSDQKPERGLVVRDLAYRQVDVTADRADCMSKTHKRINRETWKQAPQSYSELERDPFGCRVRALYWAVNAQAIVGYESPETGFWSELEPAIAWLTKQGADLALQCRLITGQAKGRHSGHYQCPRKL
jgi:hypothetical protein